MYLLMEERTPMQESIKSSDYSQLEDKHKNLKMSHIKICKYVINEQQYRFLLDLYV